MRTRNLRAILTVLREFGVTAYKQGPLELTLGAVAPAKSEAKAMPVVDTPRSQAIMALRAAGLSEDLADDLEREMGIGQ